MNTIGDRISRILEEKGITQRELAEKAVITEVSLSRYINGGRMPKGDVIVRISNALGVSCDYLMGTYKNKPEEKQIMKLTIKTELGGFDFLLSKTSVIYLLSLARELEDEGDPKFDINNKVYNINDIVDKAEGLKFPPEEEQEDDPTTEDKGVEEPEQEEQPEDFGKLLDEYDQKRKRQWNDTPQNAKPDGGKYKGFLLIKCDHCGEVRGFCAKQPIDEYRCNGCGEKTKLKDLRRMFMDCECGRHSRYYTNETAEVVTHNCIECGAPVDMMLNSRRTAYVSIGGGSTRKNTGGYNHISTARHKW